MFNFFVEEAAMQGERFCITGPDHNHIRNVLRMQVGDTFLVSCAGFSHLCRLEAFEGDAVIAQMIEENYQDTELPVRFVLFQGLPKGDKLELIIQKTVELGVAEIVPVQMSRCVVKLDEKKAKAKQTRWQAIAESAAKQSKRSVIPAVSQAVSYKQALAQAKELDLLLVPYESACGMAATREALAHIKAGMSVGILIGPEGGFDPAEIALSEQAGGLTISLGKRILRAETAAVTAVGMGMLHVEMNL